MFRIAVTLSNALFLSAFVLGGALVAEDRSWPSFRGAERTGVAQESRLLRRWPKAGPKLLWKTVGAGRGYASVAISDGQIVTLGDGLSTTQDPDEYLTCFDQATGKPLWKTKTGPAWNQGQSSWQGSRGTPTIDGDRVYVVTPFGKLICVDREGVLQWQTHLKEDLGGKKADSWGYSESVLIDGDRLICTPGGPRNTMVALNKLSGAKIWSTSRPDDRGAGHASIVISQVGPTRVYVQTTGSGLMGVRASDGRLLWKYDIEKTTAVIPTPIVRDEFVFFSVGYGRGGALLKQSAQAGEVNVQEIYPLKTKLGNKHGGVVLVGDYLYGDSDDNGIPFCADFQTGEIQWKSRGSGKNSASMLAADGHVYVRYSNGIMTLVRADPESFQEVGSFKVPGSGEKPSWAHPVILDGRLYLREADQILCYQISR